MSTPVTERRPERGSPGRPPRGRPSRRQLLAAGAAVVVVLLVLVSVAVSRAVQHHRSPTQLPITSPSAPSGAPATAKLAWAPPVLTNPLTVDVTNANANLKLQMNRDYVLKMPSTPLTAQGGLRIFGGHNVVLIGGEIETPSARHSRGLYLHAQTGTIHVEGLLITGPGLSEGIDLAEGDGATVQLEDLHVDTVHGTRTTNHADVIQSWAGPSVLRVDHLTGYTGYQGFFLLPNQFWHSGEPSSFDLRDVDLHGDLQAGYMLWRSGSWPLHVQDVYMQRAGQTDRDQLLWPKGSATWATVHQGSPPGGSFVPAGVAGTGYRSPGYLS